MSARFEELISGPPGTATVSQLREWLAMIPDDWLLSIDEHKLVAHRQPRQLKVHFPYTLKLEAGGETEPEKKE